MYPGTSEMMGDALYISLQGDLENKKWGSKVKGSIPELDNFKINWRAGAQKLIIVWTDEGYQSYLEPKVERSDLIALLNSLPDVILHLFTTQLLTSWDSIVNAGNGEKFLLTSDPDEMYANLLSILDESVCIEP
jgi:hypothetical protein